VVFRDLVVVPHCFDVISVINDHVLDRIKIDGQGVLVVESDASHFTVRDRTDFKRVVSPVMAYIWKQIIPAIEQ
jgi:hypothetical protein